MYSLRLLCSTCLPMQELELVGVLLATQAVVVRDLMYPRLVRAVCHTRRSTAWPHQG